MKIKINFVLSFIIMAVFFSCSKIKDNTPENATQTENTNKGSINSAGIKEGESEFTVQYLQPRKIYKIEKEDLNNDSVREVIVLSAAKDTSDVYNSFYNFDMVEVFALDTAKGSYKKILSDTVDYSESCLLFSLADNGKKQILINTNLGGNNEVVSKGMFIYDMTASDKINLLKYFDTGAPEIIDIKKDGNSEIIISDLFYGVMPQSNAINFVKEILKLENETLINKNSEFGEYYDTKIKELVDRYYGVKRKVEMGMQMSDLSYPLYREAAEVIVNYYAKGDMKGLRKFWEDEKLSLEKNIPADEFLDLSNFILKALPSAKNA